MIDNHNIFKLDFITLGNKFIQTYTILFFRKCADILNSLKSGLQEHAVTSHGLEETDAEHCRYKNELPQPSNILSAYNFDEAVFTT